MVDPLAMTVQATPNPNAAKFTLNRIVATQGKTYRDAATADGEWAKHLLTIVGVTQVFAVNNFISITKSAEADWQIISPQVEGVLKRAFA